MQKLYDYIRERGTILPIHDYNQELLMQDDVQKRVAESIRSGKCAAYCSGKHGLHLSDCCVSCILLAQVSCLLAI